ncbi:MAG: archaeosortase/exosortase family protein [Verrucomicrobiota bacterium]
MSTNLRDVSGWVLPMLFSFLSIVFYGPATVWLLEETASEDQLLHALIILGLAGTYLIMQRKERMRLFFDFGPQSMRMLIGSFFIVGLSALLSWPLLMVIAYVLAIYGWLLFVFGEKMQRVLTPIMVGFGGYLVLTMVLPHFDWWLRLLAGRYASTALYYLGYTPQLFVATGQEAKLILELNGHHFEVAPECNGFGVLGGSLLLALLLVTYGRLKWIDRGLVLLLTAIVAITTNLIRIVMICMLAPAYTKEQYWTMHELVGTFTFWGALVLVWFMVHRLFPPLSRPGRKETEALPPSRVLFFDQDCGLCQRSVRFLESIDTKGKLHFAPLQGQAAKEMLARHPEMKEVDSIILLEGWETESEAATCYSEAVLKACKHIGGVWAVAYLGMIAPTSIRDGLYRWIARHRRKWFGSGEECSWQPPQTFSRYLP